MECRFFGCILVIRDYPDYAYILKLGAVGITAAIGLLLFGLTKKLLSKINKSKKMHNTIIVIIASTTICEFFPSVVSQVYNSITNDTLSLHLGPYRTTLIAVNISFCSWIYYKTLKKNFTKGNSNSRIHPSSFNAIVNQTKSVNQNRQVTTILS
uniref:Serpentine receptor class gamma n=1 Tax=Panagrolaimus sp. PS1159 TaxID=55785 RepID=A0AC35GUK5_9BILA